MNNKNTAAKAKARTRIVIAFAASLVALWQLPDPVAPESSAAKPNERMAHKQQELNVIAQPAPAALKPIPHLTL